MLGIDGLNNHNIARARPVKRAAKHAVLLALLFAPASAQAIVVTPYRELTLQCRSIQSCQPAGTCRIDETALVTLSFAADTYFSSHAPFAPGRGKWQRSIVPHDARSAQAPSASTYRTLSKAFEVAQVWKSASYEERQDGWFGSELPTAEDTPDHEAKQSFLIFHTRTRSLENPTLFKTKAREILVFSCHEAT